MENITMVTTGETTFRITTQTLTAVYSTLDPTQSEAEKLKKLEEEKQKRIQVLQEF